MKNLRHRFNCAIPDGADATIVRPSNWNDEHEFLLGYRRITASTDAITNDDHFTLLNYVNNSGAAVTLPAPSVGAPPANPPFPPFSRGWYTRVCNTGDGEVMITVAGGATINGEITIEVASKQALDIHATGTSDYIGSSGGGGAPSVLPTQQIFTSGSGTYTTPAGCRHIEVICTAGGGGGASSRGGGGVGGSSGGGGGGTAIAYINDPAATYAYDVGAGGAIAGTGGNSTFGALTANGGLPGIIGGVVYGGVGGAGGTATGGTVNLIGGDGGTGGWGTSGTADGSGGHGGGSMWGSGGTGGSGGISAAAGRAYGSGGGAGSGLVSSLGGIGASGIIIVKEFYW